MFKGPDITKGDGNLGAQGTSDDNIHGMVFGGVLPGGGATYTTLGDSVELIQASDADALGFTSAYDAANTVLIRYHINEFFTINPNGRLWIMVVAQATTMTQMCNLANNYLKKLIIDSGKKIKSCGVVRNPAAGYVPTLTGGLDNDVNTAIPIAQQLVDDFALQNVYIDMVVIEGRQINGIIATITDQRTQASPNVHVAALQDKDVADLNAAYQYTAAVGSVLGSIGVRRVEEDLGTLQVVNCPPKFRGKDYPLNDTATGRWLRPAISSGALVSTLTPAEVTVLKDRAYIFADSYPEYPGVFLVGSAACTLATSDFAYGVNTRVWNKGARIACKKLTPKFNQNVETDDNGYISTITASEWEKDVKNSKNGLGTMLVDGHCQKVDAFINPVQPIYTNSTLDIEMSIKPFGYARTITGKLSFSIN